MKPKRLALALANLALAAVPAYAATVLYSDDFSGNVANNLNGTPPDTRITQDGASATATWTASTNWKADGSNSATGSDSAFLAFTPTVGRIYTLSGTLSQPSGGTGNGRWAALGFTGSNDTSIFWQAPNNASPWILYRAADALDAGNSVTTYAGPGALVSGDKQNADTVYTGAQTLSVVLDTTGAAWKAEWYVGATLTPATLVREHTFVSNPTITNIGLGRSNGVGADFSSFSMTVIPEPSAALLGGLGALLLLRRRRN